ncbi:MAG: sigma-70 family RNA polymerase sigma factor, partial [Ketobacter sp.]
MTKDHLSDRNKPEKPALFSADELNRLYRYGLSLTGERDRAYDLLQTALEKYLRQSQAPANAMRYVRKIMHNQFIDDYRQQRHITTVELDEQALLDFDVRTLEQMVIDEQTLDQVWRLLDPLERELMYLWAVEGFTAQQIATELEQPRGSVLSRIHRIRKKLTT